jgi:hypothetical protein
MSFKFAPVALLALAFGFSSCEKGDKNVTPTLRSKMDANSLTATSRYTESFKDANGQSTVDLSTSNQRLDMFTEFNNYMALVATPTGPTTLEVAKLRGMYANTGNYFTGTGLNASGLQLRNTTAASMPAASAEASRTYIDNNITKLADVSRFVNNTATDGTSGRPTPGRLGRYLVDEKGIEVNQVIQKALIGALLLDQINNTLLTDQGLSANNSKVVEGKLYSELEHNWDLAYGYLTSKPIMTTVFNANDRERFLAGYLNEKNGPASPAVYMAFLKGRAAIVNNDKNEVRNQANIIRTELERTIALSAVSYLESWRNNSDPAVKAHALAEGLGFIYSLRFCTKYGADAAFSDAQLNGLLSGTNGAWDLTPTMANTAITAIKDKFSIQ